MKQHYLLTILAVNFALGTVPDPNAENTHTLRFMSMSGDLVYTREMDGHVMQELRDIQDRDDLGYTVKRLCPDWTESEQYVCGSLIQSDAPRNARIDVIRVEPYFVLTDIRSRDVACATCSSRVYHYDSLEPCFDYYSMNQRSGWQLVLHGHADQLDRDAVPEMLTMQDMNEYLAAADIDMIQIFDPSCPYNFNSFGSDIVYFGLHINTQARCFDFKELIQLIRIRDGACDHDSYSMPSFTALLKYCGWNVCNWFAPQPGYYFQKEDEASHTCYKYELHLPYDAGVLRCGAPWSEEFPKTDEMGDSATFRTCIIRTFCDTT